MDVLVALLVVWGVGATGAEVSMWEEPDHRQYCHGPGAQGRVTAVWAERGKLGLAYEHSSCLNEERDRATRDSFGIGIWF